MTGLLRTSPNKLISERLKVLDIKKTDYLNFLSGEYEINLREYYKLKDDRLFQKVRKIKTEYYNLAKELPVKPFKAEFLEATDNHIGFAQEFLEKYKNDPVISKNLTESLKNLNEYKNDLQKSNR